MEWIAIWVNGIADNTMCFAYKRADIVRTNDLVTELEATTLGKNFCEKWSEAFFVRLAHGP
ncbi:hypothetical protein N9Z11_00095 [Mariniblastus sp.]|nr:hypothetical protein [Mariniblastus sp.]